MPHICTTRGTRIFTKGTVKTAFGGRTQSFVSFQYLLYLNLLSVLSENPGAPCGKISLVRSPENLCF